MLVCSLPRSKRDLLDMLIQVIYGADLDKRKSITGYVFTVGGCAVS
jgi:hypothetical protein